MTDEPQSKNRLDRIKVMEAAVQIMEDEGVEFGPDGCVDWAAVRWIPKELRR